MFSLWRGDQLLGHINPELPSDDATAISGVLQPTDAFELGPDIMQVMQTSQGASLDWPGAFVFQHIAKSTDAVTSGQITESIPARPLGDPMSDSVPLHLQLALRDATGSVVATHVISIMGLQRTSRDMQRLCDAAGVAFSGWCVIAGRSDVASDTRHRRRRD